MRSSLFFSAALAALAAADKTPFASVKSTLGKTVNTIPNAYILELDSLGSLKRDGESEHDVLYRRLDERGLSYSVSVLTTNALFLVELTHSFRSARSSSPTFSSVPRSRFPPQTPTRSKPSGRFLASSLSSPSTSGTDLPPSTSMFSNLPLPRPIPPLPKTLSLLTR